VGRKSAKQAVVYPERIIAGYVRVSSFRQVTEGDSLEAQQNMVAEYVRHQIQKDPSQIVFYIERGKSGKNQNRPELQRLRRDIESGKIGTVIAFKLDRLTRSPGDFEDLWRLLQAHGVELVTLRERFDTTSYLGRAMLDIALVFARMEREQTAERTLAVMQDRIERGLSNGSIKWGYRHDPAQQGRLIVDPEWGPIIKEHFFNAFERLGSAGAVQRHLRQVGIIVPKRKSKDGKIRGGKPFSKQQVVRVLSNPVYLGTLVWGELRNEKTHEALVTQDQFDRIEKLLSRNRISKTHKNPTGQYGFLLKGVLRCKCGYMMTSYFSTGRDGKVHYYYSCTNRTHHGRGGCDTPYVPAKAIDDAVVERVMAVAGDEQAQDQIVRMAIGMADEDVRRIRAEMDRVNQRLSVIEQEIGNLVRALKAMGEQAIESVRDGLKECETERKQLTETLNALAVEEQAAASVTGEAERFLNSWRRIRDLFNKASPAIKRELVQSFLEELVWAPADRKGKSGIYRLKFFPEVISDGGSHSTGPGNPDSGGDGTPANPRPGNENAPVLSPVRDLVRKAPQVGLEPIQYPVYPLRNTFFATYRVAKRVANLRRLPNCKKLSKPGHNCLMR
jgi:site-specific DNA recombinase